MSPLVEVRLKTRAESVGILFDNPVVPFVITDEMKLWKDADWKAASKAYNEKRWAARRAVDAWEKRLCRIDQMTKAVEDVEMATDLVEGGTEAFRLWAPRMSQEQFDAAGYILFHSAAYA